MVGMLTNHSGQCQQSCGHQEGSYDAVMFARALEDKINNIATKDYASVAGISSPEIRTCRLVSESIIFESEHEMHL